MKGALLVAAALLAVTPNAAAAEAPTGTIRGVVFAQDGGRPLEGLSVRVAAGPSAKTNANGAFLLIVPVASEPQEVSLTVGGEGFPDVTTPPVPVVPGTITEVVVTVSPDGRPPRVDVESAKEATADDQRAEAAKKASAGPPGTLSGQVIDQDKQRPVRDARIYVRGQQTEGKTDKDGRFSMELPSGTHDITVVHSLYTAQTLRGIEIAPNGTTQRRIELAPASVELAGFTISAPRIVGSTLATLNERRKQATMAEIIGAEQMSRSGDSDAAGALKRATGVTVQGGRFVYIRGLGPRYTATLLNGSELPSPEPDRRVVPLDMFPAGLLESVSIQKTYSADMPGGFGGGVVKIQTRPFPGELQANVSLSVDATTGTTFDQGLMGKAGPTDWLGVDGGFRALPDEVRAASEKAPLLETDMFSSNGYTASKLEAFGELMKPGSGWQPTRETIPPGVGLGVDLGDSFDFDWGRFGFLTALSYDSDWQKELYRENFCDFSGCNANYDFEQLEMRITTSGILSLGVDIGDEHELRWTTFVNRITSDEARFYSGNNDDVQTDIRVSRLRWVEQTMVFNQLRGKHVVPGLLPAGDAIFDWRYALSTALRYEPDRLQTRYDYEPGTDVWFLADRPDGNMRVFSDLIDMAHDLGLDATLPLMRDEDLALEVDLKTGVGMVYKDREVDTRRYRFQHKGPLSNDFDIITQSPDQLFVPAYIGPDGFQLAEVTLPTDNYTGEQLVLGLYAMGELMWDEQLKIQLGVRAERSSQTLETYEPFNPNATPIGADLTTFDVLPSLNLSWEFADGHFLRFATARSVTRPDFRELSPATFNDVTGGKQSFGNPDLERTLITHVDLRWDWYPTDGELLSFGAFYKHFVDPIEQVLIPSAQLSQSWDNVPEANNVGLELEFRKNFGFLHEALEDLELSGNVAWIYSRVSLEDLDTIQTSKTRALEGQAPFVINVQLSYDNEETGTTAAILYNTSGAYISEVGAQGRSDENQQPQHILDVVVSQSLGDGWKLKLKAKNLLDSELVRRLPEFEGGGRDVKRVSKGRTFSLGISKKW